MLDFKPPIKRHSGLRVVVSQRFGVNQKYYSKYNDSNGNPLIGHNGIDLILGYDQQKMYGTDINPICAGRIVYTIWDNPMSSKGNGITQDSDVFVGSDGNTRLYRIVYWHNMNVRTKVGDRVTSETHISDMGNSGIVFPEPTIAKPWNGVHLHLAIYVYILLNGAWTREFPNNGFNGAIDPHPIIGDLNLLGWERKNNKLEWFGELLKPIIWAINKIRESINTLKNKG